MSHNRSLFNEDPLERNVTYEFHCVKKDEEFLVKIDQRGNYKLRGTRVLIGALNFHFVRRLWDARLQLTSSNFIGGDYHSLAQDISQHFQIVPAEFEGLEISTQSSDPELRIKSCTLTKQTRHTSKLYPDLLLHLTEFSELENVSSIFHQNLFRGRIKSADRMIATQRLWWEVSLSSIKIAAILKENETLELGQIAAWRPENIIASGVVGDLTSLCQAIITRIDSVGLSNQGPKAQSIAKMGSQNEQQSRELAAGLAYW